MSVRLAIVGLGNMGSSHCKLVQSIHGLELVAACDIDPDRLTKITERYDIAGFSNHKDLLKSKRCDAVLIATPHYDHTTIGIAALQAGYHVMVEKPVSVHKADAQKLIAAHTNKDQVFAAMFNQRTNPGYQLIKNMIENGELGSVRRVQWTITDWFRSQAYYDSGGWRATWAGEGGGVLLNQCPHQLDLLQWLFGMPVLLRSFCHLGKTHNIEVEDEVTTYLEYENGVTGVFITTTGEAPGINRLEIAAENGQLIYVPTDEVIRFSRNAIPVSQAIRENPGFTRPDLTERVLTVDGTGGQHRAVLENFAAAILTGSPLLAPAKEGINSVELANAMLLSGWTGKTIELPINARHYANQLKKRVKASRFEKTSSAGVVEDMSESF